MPDFRYPYLEAGDMTGVPDVSVEKALQAYMASRNGQQAPPAPLAWQTDGSKEVTDPELLKRLNAPDTGQAQVWPGTPVADEKWPGTPVDDWQPVGKNDWQPVAAAKPAPQEVTDPDLLRRLNAPDNAHPVAKSSPAAQPASASSSGWGDFFSSIPRGAVKGFSSMASQMGQAEAPNSGMTEEQVKAMPSPEQGTALTEQNLTGQLHRPQTGAGRYGEAVGEVLGNPQTWLGPGGPVAKAATATGSALTSEAAGNITQGSPWEPAARLAGALVGGHAVAASPRAITPIPKSPERQALINTLKSEGVTSLTAGQKSGNSPLRYTESVAADTPFSGTSAADINATQQRQFTRAASRYMGEDADQIEPEVLNNARARIGQQLEDVAAKLPIKHDKKFGDDLVQIEQDMFNEGLPEATQARIAAQVNNIRNGFGTGPRAVQVANGGNVMPGKTYQALTRKGTPLDRMIGSTDPNEAYYGDRIRTALDDAMERTATGQGTRAGVGRRAALDQLREARQQWRNMIVISKSLGGAGEDVAQGFVSPQKLRQALTSNTSDKMSYVRGKSDMGDLARAGNALMTPLKNSGTGPREAVMEMMRLAPVLAGVEGSGIAAGSHFAGIPGGIAGALAAPGVAARAVMNPFTQKWLGNNLLPNKLGASPAAITAAQYTDPAMKALAQWLSRAGYSP